MFVMDIPPDVPVQNTQVVMAQTVKAKKGTAKTCTIGVCYLIEKPAGSPSAVNTMDPVLRVWGYLKKQGQLPPEQQRAEMYKNAKVSMLQEPKHGVLGLYESTQSARYFPTKTDYRGSDRATLLVEIGDRKIKVVYFFNVMHTVPPGTVGYDPHKDKKLCPGGKGVVWEISVNPNNPGGPLLTNMQPLPMTSAFAVW